MSIFGTILSKIFPIGHPATQNTADPANAAAPAQAATAAASGASAAAPAAAAQPVDVEAVLSGLAAQRSETLNWRTSIVDLMKLLNLDSSLNARKELAGELHFT